MQIACEFALFYPGKYLFFYPFGSRRTFFCQVLEIEGIVYVTDLCSQVVLSGVFLGGKAVGQVEGL